MALFAEGILKLHWDQTVPVNLAHIAKNMGIVVALSESLAPCARIDIGADNKARITIGTQHPMVHQRYAVAQALGHRALHHLRPGSGRLIEVSGNFGVDHGQRQDSEANQFALALLMPVAVLRYSVRDVQVRTLQELAHLFQVPPILVKQRLADLDLQLAVPLALQLDRLALD